MLHDKKALAFPCPRVEIPDDFSMEARLFQPVPRSDAAARLAALEAAIRDDLKVLEYPSTPLPYEPRANVLEVAVVGAGQTGKSMAFGLRRHGVHSVKVFDRNPKGFQGPWRTYARNHLLRTKKASTGGLEWGFPNLHFKRWADAKFGEEYHAEITYIPRLVWADYLDWYSDVLSLPIEYETEVQDITWVAERDCYRLETPTGSFESRFVVICSGIESAGNQRFPSLVSEKLPKSVYSHTMTDLDVQSLAAKDVVVIGGGASAFDTANAILAAGARNVDMMVRRPGLPTAHRMCWGSKWNGYHRHYVELSDDLKWAYSLADTDLGVPPPRHTYYEAIRDERFRLFGSAGIDDLNYADGKIVGVYGGTSFSHDFMICGTGSQNSVSDQPELKSLIGKIGLWKDFYTPENGTHPELENSPYLGSHLQFKPRRADDAYIERMYYLCSGVSHLSGFRCNLSGLQFAAPRVCHDISRQLFITHADEIKSAFDNYALWE